MRVRPIYEFQRGEAGGWMEEATFGDPSVATDLVSKLKPITDPRAAVPDVSVAPIATLSVTHTPAQGDIGAGWTAFMSDTVSAGLTPGYYIGDIGFKIAGVRYVTEPVIIHITPAISI